MGIKQLPSGRHRLQIRRAALKVDEVFDTLKEAEAALKRYAAKSTGKGVKTSHGMTIDEAWSLYIDSRSFLEKKPNTRSSEETHAKPVLKKFGPRALKALTADDVDAFIVTRTRAHKAPDTIRNEVAALSSILNFGRTRKLIATNVTIGIKRPSKEPTVHRMPPGHEGALMKVLKHPNYRYRAVARLALLVRETGARPGEWVNLKCDDIDLAKQRVVFQNTKYKRMPRTVPLTQVSVALLTSQMADISIDQFDKFGASELVFPTLSRQGEIVPIPYSGAIRDMKNEDLLPMGLRAHNGRHEFISTLVEASELDDSRIMSIVGHHSPASMQIYTHARNIRFLPQLEALEGGRRKERAQELAGALGLPPQVVDGFIVHTRKAEAAQSLSDGGNELLYEPGSVQKLADMADRLGANETERLQTLLAIQKQVVANKPAARKLEGPPKKASGRKSSR